MTERPRSSDRSHFRFCPRCARELERRMREGRARPVCPECGFVQYRSPAVGVAGVVFEGDLVALLGAEKVRRSTGGAGETISRSGRILMARRTTPPVGAYCIPCGYVEFDEEVREALAREMLEETGLVVDVEAVLAVHSNFHDPDRQTVGIWFHVRPTGGSLRPGDDVDLLRLVDPIRPDVPLAFPTDRAVLDDIACGIEDRESG